MASIPVTEFRERISRIQAAMTREKLDAVMVYGDEYRKENLRYVSNFWPIFERGACFIPKSGEPILTGAPEGEEYAREMSVWTDVRNVKEFACVSVPEEVDYPLAKFSSFADILGETMAGGRRLGLIGQWDIPAPILDRVKSAAPGVEIVDASPILNEMRLIKSPAEIDCLREAGRQACEGYAKLMEYSVPGNSEALAAGAGQGAALMAGAEAINFCIYGSGPRTATIIGRSADRILQDGDMIMAALAVQYQGYVATAAFPFVVGKANDEQKRFLTVLLEGADAQLPYLKDGAISGEMVRAVKEVYRKHGMEEYDVYPPMHGIGLAEAESPYPDEKSIYPFRAGMCVNSDVSLFGHPAGSNRIEEGFIIGKYGPESITPFIRDLVARRVGVEK